MRRAALTAGLAVAAFLAWHGFGLAAVLLYVWASAMVSSAGTAKSRATEDRVSALENQTATNSTGITTVTTANTTTNSRVSSLSGAATANPAVSGAVVYSANSYTGDGYISETSDIYGGINGNTSTGGPNAGSGVAAHTHGFGHLHSHGHTHSYGHTPPAAECVTPDGGRRGRAGGAVGGAAGPGRAPGRVPRRARLLRPVLRPVPGQRRGTRACPAARERRVGVGVDRDRGVPGLRGAGPPGPGVVRVGGVHQDGVGGGVFLAGVRG